QTAIIRDNIVETTIYTRDRDQGIVESNDKVFLWSSDDFESAVEDPRLYTAGKAFAVSSFPSTSSWLRGFSTYNNGVAVTYWIDGNTIKISTAGLKSSYYVQPVFWIKMPTDTTAD
ncbi:MAG: hypothetical protein K2F55_05140, partial [Erysipelotrichaceae bacterium]|nr:hypothetical protein [Erysipelotrichaceae bacterium]